MSGCYVLLVYVRFFFFSSRRRHTRCALVTGVQTCALPISITTAAEARAAGRAAQDNREVPLHDITGHMYAIGVPRSLHYAYLGGIDDSLEDDGVDTTADPDADGYGWERKALAGL